MSLTITPELLAAAYEYLRVSKPFCRWKLPHADEIQFHVIRAKDKHGDYSKNIDHIIRVSESTIGHTDGLMKVLAHEIIHLHQCELGDSANHNPEFTKCAKSICKEHGWSLKDFV